MDLFGIGWEELLLILVIALVIFGPGKIPEFARQMGRFVREVNRYSSVLTKDFKEEFQKGLEEAPKEPRKPGKTPKEPVEECAAPAVKNENSEAKGQV